MSEGKAFMELSNPYTEIEKAMLGEIYYSTEMRDNLLVLCDEYGSRFDGTEEARKAAEFILEKFTSYGTRNPHIETYDYQGWLRGPSTFTVTSPVIREVACISLPYCHPGEVEGKLVFVGDGTIEDFERVREEIQGSIVMAKTSSPPGHRWMHRMEKYDRAVLLGAVGFIWMQHLEGQGPETGSIGWTHDALIPGVGIAKEYGDLLVRLAQRYGEVRLRIKTTDQLRPMKAHNIICSVGGARVPEESVILGCHVDGHDIAQGALDPVSGTVVVMEAARVLSKVTDGLDRSVRFVIYSNEEVGLFGSITDVNLHREELPRVRFMLNLDAAGRPGRKGVLLHRWPELEGYFHQAGEEMGGDFPVGQRLSGFSDHFYYFLEGVPTGGLGDAEGPPPSGRGYGHTFWDTADKPQLADMRDAAAVACRLAMRVSNAPTWPVQHRSKAEVRQLLDTEPNLEQYRLTEELVRKHGEGILNWWQPSTG
ncbi:MAG: M28 family peptidase [Chloroflexota bacterium]